MSPTPTTDNPIGHDVAREARNVLDVLDGGGIAIIPLNVAHAVLGRTDDAEMSALTPRESAHNVSGWPITRIAKPTSEAPISH